VTSTAGFGLDLRAQRSWSVGPLTSEVRWEFGVLSSGQAFSEAKCCRRDLLYLERGTSHHRRMEEPLQHQETAQCFGLSPTGPGNHRSDGSQADHAL